VPVTFVDPNWRETFERALDADPSDQGVRRDLADHLDEVGEPDAEPVRWLAERGKYPQLDGSFGGRVFSGWHWWMRDPDFPAHCHIGHVASFLQSFTAGYPTRRDAEADFCRAYHLARAEGWGPTVSQPADL
jgi:hypothetical protein